MAVSVFPDELYQAPRSWAEEAYPNLIHYNQLDKGGHFAAWEQPELFSERSGRGCGRCVLTVLGCAHALARRGDRVAQLQAAPPAKLRDRVVALCMAFAFG